MFKETEFRAEINNFVALVASLSMDMSWSELAKKAELSTQTVNNLVDCRTKSPHYKTLFKLGRAVGLRANISGAKITVEVDKKSSKSTKNLAAVT